MRYGEATHGWWCNSRTYPTRCKYCGERVFFFSCSCGSKVFFQELGWPWPEHRCIQYLTAQYGREFIERGMAIMMMTPGVDIGRKVDRNYTDKVKQQLAVSREPEVVRCDPYDGCQDTEAEGIVRELIPRVDVFKRFDISENSVIGAALFGPLAKDEYAQVTVHTGALAGEDNWSFTFFVSRKLLDQKRIVKGDFVTCKLRAFTVHGRGTVWVCDDLRGVFE